MLLVGVLAGIVQASESAPSREEVAKLYVATFDRAPDAAGLEYWVEKSGLTLSQIARSFFDQPETKARYPKGTAPADFVKSVYENLFDREPDAAGLEYWVGELKNGHIDKSRFIEAVINGALGDDAKILANKTAVGLAYAQQGLQDPVQAEAVMEGVDASEESVRYIVGKIQSGNLGDDPWAGYTPFAFLSPDSNVTVPENGKAAFTIRASHPEGTMVYYTLGGKDRGAFDVDGKRGTVTFKKAPDFEKKKLYEVTAIAVLYSVEESTQRPKKEARAQRRIEKPVAVHIENVPEKPTLALFRKAMHMDQSPGDVVGKVRVLNSGDGKISSWSLIGTRDFRILRNGVIINTTPFDFDKDTTLVFKIRVENSVGQVDTQNALVTLVKDNTPPVAFDQNVTVYKNSQDNPIDLNATDAEGDPLTYTIVDRPLHGRLSGTAPHLLYTPDENYTGDDSFTFRANDGREDSNLATVHIRVDDHCWDSGIFKGRISLVGNDYVTVDRWYFHHNGGPLSINLLSEMGNPWTDIDGDGVQTKLDTYIYLFSGNDQHHSYIAYNDDASTSGPPAEDGTTHHFDSYLGFSDLPAGDYVLSISAYPFSKNETFLDVQNSSWFYNTGPYQITFKGDMEMMRIPPNASAVCVQNTPPVAYDQNVIVQTNSTDNPIELNATDADGDPLSYQIVEGPSHGTLSGTAPHLTYTSDADYTGEDSFTYLANDGIDDSNIATVRITVKSGCKNVLFDDTFDDEEVGSLPLGWVIKYNGTGDANQKVVDTVSVSPEHSFQLEGRAGWAANIYKDLLVVPDRLIVEADIQMNGIVPNWTGWIALYNKDIGTWGTQLGGLSFYDGKFSAYYAGGPRYEIAPFEAHRWYHVRIDYNISARNYRIFIDGEQVSGTLGSRTVSVFPMHPATPYIPRQLMLTAGNGGTVKVFYDNVKAYTDGCIVRRNLALHKIPISVEGAVESGNSEYATDGYLDGTWYFYEHRSDNFMSFTLDLGREYTIDGYRLYPVQANDYTIETSTDRTHWTVRHQADGLHDSPIEEIEETEPYKARYIRYTAHNHFDGYIGIREFEVYGYCVAGNDGQCQ